MYQAGLVLEGGGFKGIYTSGVLDFFWIKVLIFLPAMESQQGRAPFAAFCPGKGEEPIM